jgi:hypothetical protein
MSNSGLDVAREFGKRLPHFPSLLEAQQALLIERDRLLDMLRRAAPGLPHFAFDLSPQSLKGLERWYFSLLEKANWTDQQFDRASLERAIAMYFGAVVVHNCPAFSWTVTEFPFLPGRYEIGIERPLYRRSLTLGLDLAARPNNKRRQSLWRDFRECAS